MTTPGHPSRGAEATVTAAGLAVRGATSADVGILVDFQVRHAREVEGMTLDPATVGRGVAHVLAHPALGSYLVAEDAARGVVACLLILSEWSDWRAREVWWIHSVYVEPAARGARVFDALHARVVELARAAGAAGVRLYVDKRNERARKVYERLGYSNAHYELYESLFD